MTNILISPGRYVQGAGAIRDIGKHAALFGKRALITGSPSGISRVRKGIVRSLKDEGIESFIEPFNRESTWGEVHRLKGLGEEHSCDMVIGVGGGKGIDTGKAVAHLMGVAKVVVPTVASSDAPCSALSAIYTEDHILEEYFFYPKNPDLVLVDTAACITAPIRYMVSGMGDALATWFEADACQRSASKNCAYGGPGAERGTSASYALARLCYDTLIEYGLQAKRSAQEGIVTPAVDRVIEANILLSGLGFESGGLAAAHSIYSGFTLLDERHGMLHGEIVAFGTITQLIMEGRRTDEIEEVLKFCESVGLPYTLSALNLETITSDEVDKVAEKSCEPKEAMHNMPIPVDPVIVRDAILGADALGRAFKKEQSH